MEKMVKDLRPSEVIRNYLMAEFERSEVLSGTRLPSINALSRHLDVSPSTVQAVLGELAKEGVVRSVRGKGVFFVKEEGDLPRESDSRVVTINLQAKEMAPTNIWAGLISLGVLGEFSEGAQKMLLRPAARSSQDVWDEALLKEECAESDGAILFVNRQSRELRRRFDEAGKPSVFINPPVVNATKDFVSTDYFGNGLKLGRAWVATGRKRITLALHASPGISVSAMLVLMGFTAAVEEAPEQEAQLLYKVIADSADAAEVLESLELQAGGRPDALYFFSSTLAESVVEELRKREVSVPDELSVAAGTSDERLQFRRINLSVFSQSLGRLGAEAARMLAWRFEHHNESAAGRYLACRYVAGETTRPEENEYIKKMTPDQA